MDNLDSLQAKNNKDDPEFLRYFVLDQFKNIAQSLNDKSLDANYGKKEGKLNWVKLRKLLCNEIYSSLAEEWNRMWEKEDLTNKIKTIQNLQKESDPNTKAWRPSTGDISHQVQCLKRCASEDRKNVMESFVKEREANIEKLKTELTSQWAYCREMEEKIAKYREENDQTYKKIQESICTSQSDVLLKKRKLDKENIST